MGLRNSATREERERERDRESVYVVKTEVFARQQSDITVCVEERQ